MDLDYYYYGGDEKIAMKLVQRWVLHHYHVDQQLRAMMLRGPSSPG